MKTIRISSLCILCVSLILSWVLIPISANEYSSEDLGTIEESGTNLKKHPKNIYLYNIYRSLVSNQSESNTINSYSNEKDPKDSNELGDFFQSEADDIVVTQQMATDSLYSVIAHDQKNNNWFYAEVIENTDEFLFFVNNNYYLISEQNGGLSIFTSDGKEIPVLESLEYNSDGAPNFACQYSNPEIGHSPNSTNATWVNISSGLRKTSTDYLQVLSVINAAVGLFSVAHPVLGAINAVLGAGVTVGSVVAKTYYISYSQYYRSDCTTYIKEVQDWYEYSNYTGYVKSRTNVLTESGK